MLNVKKTLTKILNDDKNIYTFVRSVTFNSSGVGTVMESGVTTSTRVLVTRCSASASSLSFTAKVTANGTITLSAYNTQNAGSSWSGTTDITFLVDNR